MRTRASFLTILAALLGALTLVATPAAGTPPAKAAVMIIQWNLFPGFDDVPVVAAAMSGDEGAMVEAATVAWQQVHATDFHRRVRDIAGWIRLAGPDIVSVNEAARYVAVNGSGQTVETIDFLDILVAAIHDMGASYEVASLSENFEIPLPVMLSDTEIGMVTLLDRDAILVRSKNSRIHVSNPQNAHYTYNLGPPDFPLPLTRGWASIDVTIGGKSFRFVTSHLEDPSPDPTNLTPLQEAQAQEMVGIGTSGGIPVVFAGDFNTDGFRKWPTYQLLTTDLGLKDAWTTAYPRLPGLTWGQSPDLKNLFPRFTQRLDLVLFSGPFKVVDAAVIGGTIIDRAVAGMWPSDHAGLLVTLLP
jgi:endonuclease/exonuclease/phosphatase family metal-dependent hydrolase